MEVRSGRPGRGRSIANGRDLAFQHVGLAPVGLAAGRPYGAQHACGIFQELKAVASAYVLATNRQAPADVRFGLLRGRREDVLRSRIRASSRFMHRSKIYTYSITSSASASNLSGTSRPSAFAVLRFMIISNLVGSSTGRSAGLSPLRMRPA